MNKIRVSMKRNYKKKPIEIQPLKSIITNPKFTGWKGGVNNRFKQAEERICEFEDRTIEIIQSVE